MPDDTDAIPRTAVAVDMSFLHPADIPYRETPGSSAARPRICRPGENCWRVETAHRVGLLVDGANYYAALRQALLRARRSVLILGWDFDPDVVLDPSAPAARTIRDTLLAAAAAAPRLEIRVLVWEASVFFRPGQRVKSLLGDPLDEHPRIRVSYDDGVPLGGSHHEKVVAIDDAVAFVGGIDLCGRRWDTAEHAGVDPRRVNPDGSPYGPVHDIQMLVDGPAAAAVASLVRARWQRVTGEALRPGRGRHDPWPEALPRLRDAAVAIARTVPPTDTPSPVQECAALDDDALAAARSLIYIEAQYLTRSRVADVLERHLRAAHGPEIVVVTRRECKGWIEQFVMGENRDRLVRRLKRADLHRRLAVFTPVSADGADISIHAKLVMVDDCYLRVGSSNLNNRSVGLDSECDLAVECRDGPADAAIRQFRRELIAEHLGAAPEEVAAIENDTGSVIETIARLSAGGRHLRPLDIDPDRGEVEPIAGTAVLDPEEPFDLAYVWRGD